MNKITKALCIALLIAIFFSMNVAAAEQNDNVIYLDNGDYIVVQVTQTQGRALNTCSGNKAYIYYSNSGNEEWRAVVSGTFAYTGTTSYCTSYNCNVTITDTSWYTISKTASKDGATAIGNVTMGCKLLGITIKQQSATIRLTCDKNGNLS